MLPVDDARDISRVGDEYLARREVRVAHRRYVQLL
jgi:hypothetical protein